MTSLAGNMNGAILENYDFSRYEKIIDVGGGFGSFMMELLSNYPHLRGVIYDLPGVVDTARQIIEQRGMSERCECIQGNFFESIPTGADVYIMKLIIHDWNDEKSFTILKNCRQAMRPDNILLVMDQVLPPGNSPSPGKLTDLEMMIMVGGMERSESEFRTLFAKAGFEVMRIIPTSSPLMVIEAKSV
jgi:hypothetical protein